MKPKIKVLLIGGGGREHAIATSILESTNLDELKVFPGNAGFPEGILLNKDQINIFDEMQFSAFLKSNHIDLVVVGPEDPLVFGMADWCERAGVPCFGPSAYCAQIEGSKHFAKEMMQKANVPTATYAVFKDYDSAWSYCQKQSLPLVVKADGLAAGKGVTVAFQLTEVKQALEDIFITQKFGSSGEKVVIESFLEGEEASLFVLTDGEHYACLPAAQDHKRAFDGDLGPNTGGMGAYAPAPIVTAEIQKQIETNIIEPILGAFQKEGHPYKGLLYVGLMISPKGEANVVEFNCRFGDPETQCVLRLLNEDLLTLLYQSATKNLETRELRTKEATSAVVVLAAEGYPEAPKKGIPLEIPEPSGDVKVFHAGTKKQDTQIVSTGGRILGITSISKNLQDTMNQCYDYLARTDFKNTFYRKDIGRRAL
ncbi:phosphoribosylamine--glycine ligase [Leptospira ognonensis]|uniref:Phosphoribosylamine--glycine ligase n=1 Tax=Leptospira ognonensis TaxID=2484945 RepID=A0A4R9JWD7_9LEPT|nr:phosphoribosylamine--glycine ligase [Leptospira ognonensis]TGL56344.1 phosphoribosylamine--glycine ligase [Leptospira ognonensis]